MAAQTQQFNEGHWHWHPGLRMCFCPVEPALTQQDFEECAMCLQYRSILSCHRLDHLHLFTQIHRKTASDTEFFGIWEASTVWSRLIDGFILASNLCTLTRYSETGTFFWGNFRDQCLLAGAARGAGLPAKCYHKAAAGAGGGARLLLRKGC